VTLPTRKFLLRLFIFSLSATAVLGIVGVWWTGLGETGIKILASAIAADIVGFLALCCTGRVKSAWRRAIQVTGIVSACLGLVTSLYLIWWDATDAGRAEAIGRATAVLFILAVASAHACLVLPLRSRGRPARAVVTGTVICTAAAAELIANYALFPNFDPGSGYTKALTVILILDAFGTILVLLLHRFGPPRAGAEPPGTPARSPSPDPPDAKLPSVP
jgi:cytochrome bd-type quinol oxidase subunit 2